MQHHAFFSKYEPPCTPFVCREEDTSLLDTDETTDAFAAYLTEASKAPDRPVVYDETLGLAVEQPPPGFAAAALWKL